MYKNKTLVLSVIILIFFFGAIKRNILTPKKNFYNLGFKMNTSLNTQGILNFFVVTYS